MTSSSPESEPAPGPGAGSVPVAPRPGALRCRPIEETDLDTVVGLLAAGFPERPQAYWCDGLARHVARGVPDGVPRYGYLLDHDGVAVGVLLTLYTRIADATGSHLRCNLSSWYVDPKFRAAAPLLDGRAMQDKSVTYLNISASVHTRAIHEARGFRAFVRGQLLAVPSLSRPQRGQRVELFSEGHAGILSPRERGLALDHAGYGSLVLVCRDATTARAVVLQPHRIKAVPRWSASPTLACYQIVFAPEPDTLAAWLGAIGRYLLLRHGVLFVMLDANGPLPGVVGRYLHGREPRYARGPHPVPIGDLSYTERVLFGA